MFLCYDAITRLQEYQMAVIIHVAFFTFVFIFAISHLFSKNKWLIINNQQIDTTAFYML